MAAISGFFCCVAFDPLRELEPEGGGDVTLGDDGHLGVVSPVPVPFDAFGSFDTASETPPAWS